MALKRQTNVISAFSMASMTDIIFLLLIFFMVTSTYVFPTALEVSLPQSTQQTTLKPSIRVYIDANGSIATVVGDDQPQPMELNELSVWLRLAAEQENTNPSVALYADESLPYGKIVEVLNIGAEANVKMVLATKPNKSVVSDADPATEELVEMSDSDFTSGDTPSPENIENL